MPRVRTNLVLQLDTFSDLIHNYLEFGSTSITQIRHFHVGRFEFLFQLFFDVLSSIHTLLEKQNDLNILAQQMHKKMN